MRKSSKGIAVLNELLSTDKNLMKETNTVKKSFILYMVITLFFLTFTALNFAQDFRSMTVGNLVLGQDKQGAAWMSDYVSNGQWPGRLVYDWQAWPDIANDIGYHGVDIDNATYHSGHGKDLVGQTSWWAGSKNWDSPPAGKWGPMGIEAVYKTGNYPIYISDNGPVTLNSLIDTPYPEYTPVKHTRRVDMPAVQVDGNKQQPIAFDPSGNSYTIDPGLKTDAMLEARWTHPMGLTFHDKWYAWTNPAYANLVIVETTITNSGDCNASIAGIEKPNQNLTDFWVGVTHQIAGVEGWLSYGSFGEYCAQADHLLEYDPTKRYYWTWDGDAADIAGDDQFDPRGGPFGVSNAELPTGEFTAPEVCGLAFLYVSTGPEPSSNNPAQPATFRYVDYQNHLSPILDKKLVDGWNWMTGEDGLDKYMKGFGDKPYDVQKLAQPHYDPIWGVGPFNLAFNQSIKLVYVWAFGTVEEARAIELGSKVKNGQITLSAAKQEIYETGRTRLFAEFEKGRDLYFNKNLSAPFPPDPPTNLEITSGPELVRLKWDAVPGADKYRVYRATGGSNNGRVYQMVKETTETAFSDEPLIRNFSYYYYVTAVKGDLESSRFFNRTNKAAVPFRRGLQVSNWVDQVRVVPNPFNVKGNTYLEGAGHNTTGFNFAGSLREQNTVAFINLPEFCTIRIYNSIGDLVKTLEHTSGSADERWWPIITDDNQIPASGVYFYLIEVNDGPLAGEVGKGKLVIIR